MSSGPRQAVVLFDPADSGYHTFRIPALLAVPGEVLLAFCEGRLESHHDSGPIELVLRRSYDNGHSWEPLQVVCSVDGKTCGNPVPILDPASGDIVLVSVQNGADTDEKEIGYGLAGPDAARRIFVQRSSDLGTSWSGPVEITDHVKPAGWGWYATGPGHGIAIAQGEHRGRLIVPANHSRLPTREVADEMRFRLHGGHALISDDGGQTWRLGFVDENDGSLINANETTVAELADGRVVFSARNHNGSGSTRVQAVSTDGAESLTSPYRECPDIVAPQVQAGVITPDGRTLLLSTPSVTDERADLTVYVSDDAAHWRPGAMINSGLSGYSDLTTLADERVGVLYEAGEETYRDEIRFAVWTLAELTHHQGSERTTS